MKRNLILAMLLAAAILMSLARVAFAGSSEQPVEWEGNPGYIRYSLTSVGQGWLVSWDRCDNSDYVMRVNLNASYDPDRFRIYSYNSYVQNSFKGKSPIGYYLTTPGMQHLCVGFWDTRNAGGPFNVANNMFVWVR